MSSYDCTGTVLRALARYAEFIHDSCRSGVLPRSSPRVLAPATAPAQTCAPAGDLALRDRGKIVRSRPGSPGARIPRRHSTRVRARSAAIRGLNSSPDGQVKNLVDLGIRVFGEGLTIFKDEVYQPHWQEHDVYVYDLAGSSGAPCATRARAGLTMTAATLFTDGGSSLHFADRRLPITSGAGALARERRQRVNELEFVDGNLRQHFTTGRSCARPATGASTVRRT